MVKKKVKKVVRRPEATEERARPRSSVRGRNMQPRERGYRYSQQARPKNFRPPGDKTLRDDISADLIRPSWEGKYTTVVKILPNFCPENPTGPFDPTRLSFEAFDFSDFSRKVPAARYVGIHQKFTFLTHNPTDEDYNPWEENPYHILHNAYNQAIDAGEAIVNGRNVMTSKWTTIRGKGQRNDSLGKPVNMFYLQVAVYSRGKDVYVQRPGDPPKGLGPKDNLQVMQITAAAGNGLASKLNVIDPEFEDLADLADQDRIFLYGDVVDLANGRLCEFYNPKDHDPMPEGISGEMGEEEEDDRADDDGEDNFVGWEVSLPKEFITGNRRRTIAIPGDISRYEDVVRKRVQWWDDILRFPSTEEICRMLAIGFKPFPKLLEFAWGDHPEFFTDEVIGILRSRTTSLPGRTEDEEEGVDVDDRRSHQPRRQEDEYAADDYEGGHSLGGYDDEDGYQAGDEYESTSRSREKVASPNRVSQAMAAARERAAKRGGGEESPGPGLLRKKKKKPSIGERKVVKKKVLKKKRRPQ